MRVESRVFVRRRELVSFDPRHVTDSPPIGKRISVGKQEGNWFSEVGKITEIIRAEPLNKKKNFPFDDQTRRQNMVPTTGQFA